MPFRSALFFITVLILNRINVEAGIDNWLQPQDIRCEDFRRIYYDVMERCLKLGFVSTYSDLIHCYKLNSQGNCKTNETLVFSKDPCLQTKCVANIDSSGAACDEGWYNFNGTCTEAGYLGCGGEFGRRVRPDLFGDVQCVCDQQLGFVEFEGSCYFEFLQGPCESGEQLIVDIEGTMEPKCVNNNCDTSKGYIISRTNDTKNVCYFLDHFVETLNSSLLTSEEKDVLEKASMEAHLVPFSTFHVCLKAAASTGECLTNTEVEPVPGDITLLVFNIRKAFNLPQQNKTKADTEHTRDEDLISLGEDDKGEDLRNLGEEDEGEDQGLNEAQDGAHITSDGTSGASNEGPEPEDKEEE